MLIMATSGFSAKEVMDYSVTVPDESLYLFSGTMCKDEFPNQDQIVKIALSKYSKSGDESFVWTVIYGEIDFREAKAFWGTNSGRLDNLQITQWYDLTEEDLPIYQATLSQSALIIQ